MFWPPAAIPPSQAASTPAIPTEDARLWAVLAGDEEARLSDAPPHRVVLVDMAAPSERAEQGVIEVGAALQVGDLDEQVVDHAGRLYR